MMSRRSCWTALILAAGVVVQGSAKASLYSDLGTISASSPGSTSVTYNLTFNPDDFGTPGSAQFTSGNHITFYDFSPGLLPNSVVTTPSDFDYSIQDVGLTIPNFPGGSPADSPTIPNITFTYNGPILTSTAMFAVTITLAGDYTLGSEFGLYGGITTYLSTSIVSTTGGYIIPSAVAAVPEPSSLVMAGLASLVLLGLRGRARSGRIA